MVDIPTGKHEKRTAMGGQVNNGNIFITQLIGWLEHHLNIIIGRAHRRWEAIVARKHLNPTKFIHQM